MAHGSLFEAYAGLEKLAPLMREIGWSHNLVILDRCKDPLKREFYLRVTRKFGWSEQCRADHPGFLAITFAVAALSRLPAATFGTLAYFEPLAVVFFGWTIFGENLSALQLAGCATIMASGCAKAQLASRTASP